MPVAPEAAYRNDRHPRGPGPWQDEPDKVAWTDQATGAACIILRQPDGHLGGYVAVAPDHATAGFTPDALPSSVIRDLHNPITYAAWCERRRLEALSICHVSRHNPRSVEPGGGDGDDDAWWFGFECNSKRDFVPGRVSFVRPLSAERGEIYRDIAFVYAQVVRLASQLHQKALSESKQGPSRSLGQAKALPAPDGETSQ